MANDAIPLGYLIVTDRQRPRWELDQMHSIAMVVRGILEIEAELFQHSGRNPSAFGAKRQHEVDVTRLIGLRCVYRCSAASGENRRNTGVLQRIANDKTYFVERCIRADHSGFPWRRGRKRRLSMMME